MTKQELIQKINEDTHCNMIEINTILNSALNNVIDSVSKGDLVDLDDFGSFRPIMRNEQSRNVVSIKRVPCFRAGNKFLYSVRGY